MAEFPGLIDSHNYLDDADEFEPRIKIELESLNQAATDVNRLEKEINEARHKYQETFSASSQELENLRKKYGSKINKARTYYETKEMAKEAQSEALRYARKFQSANGIYLAAKETISLAELRLKDDKAASLSPAWQEMLNHALIRVMESEQEKTKSEKEHLERAAVFSEMEKKLQMLERKFKKSISKARPYFDAKSELELKLQQIKQSIEDLQQAMNSTKCQYSNSLKNLESISDCIHEARRQKLILMYPREPGVGEESKSSIKELPTLPSSNTDLNLSRLQMDKESNSDTDEEDDEPDEMDKIKEIRATTQISDYTESTSCSNDLTTKTPQKSIHFRSVVERPVLRKSSSMPSYIVEEETESSIQTFEVETGRLLLKVESGVSVTKSNHHLNKSVTTDQTGQQILDPGALCLRDLAIGRSDK